MSEYEETCLFLLPYDSQKCASTFISTFMVNNAIYGYTQSGRLK